MSSNTRIRKSQRRKNRRKKKAFLITKKLSLFLIILALLVVLSYVSYFTLVNGVFTVKEITVDGAEILSQDQIKEISGIKEGQSIFLLDLNKAQYNINKVLSTKRITIKRVLPDKVNISVVEEVPICVIQKDGKHYYLDENGTLMEITDELGDADTPVLSGFSSTEFSSVGEPAALEPAFKQSMVFDMLSLFQKNNMLDQLSEINITGENTYRIITKNGVVFTVKDSSNLQEYFDYISTVIENGETNQDINLTSGNNPIKKPR